MSAKIELNHRIHVLTRKEELDGVRVPGKVVVLDTLSATTTMVAALAFFRHAQAPQVLLECRVGRMMAQRGLVHEVEFACRFDAFPIVPVMEDGRLRCA